MRGSLVLPNKLSDHLNKEILTALNAFLMDRISKGAEKYIMK